jgi:hypothetical protein
VFSQESNHAVCFSRSIGQTLTNLHDTQDGGAVPDKVDEGGAGPDEVDKGDVMKIGDAEFKIAEGVLEGLMHTEEHTEHQFSKIGPILANMYKASGHDNDQQASPGVSAYMETLGEGVEALVQEEKVLIDVVAKNSGTVQDMINELSSLGFELQGTYKHMASGLIPIAALGQVSKSDTLLFAMPALHFTKTGAVTSVGVFAMEADKVVSDLGRVGKDVTVGVLSDRYETWFCCYLHSETTAYDVIFSVTILGGKLTMISQAAIFLPKIKSSC